MFFSSLSHIIMRYEVLSIANLSSPFCLSLLTILARFHYGPLWNIIISDYETCMKHYDFIVWRVSFQTCMKHYDFKISDQRGGATS